MGFFDTDRWNEIWQTISRNRKRSIMTALGVFWGIFMLTVLLGAGMGLGRLFRAQLGDMSTNTLLIQPSQTSLPYKGMPKNRWWRMNNDDVENVRGLKEVQYASGVYWGGEIHCSYNERKGDYSLMGYMPDYQQINPQKIIYGRFINDVDMAQKRKVCVIGTQIQKDLFPGMEDPTGKVIKVNNSYFTIIGVMRRQSTAKMFDKVMSLFWGIGFLTWIVGLGTLLAGIVGVSNIMLVLVKERTQEIGIRRALGAPPTAIISQILSESFILTFIAGVVGLTAAVGVLSVADSIYYQAVTVAQEGAEISWQISFGTGMLALFILVAGSLLAGVIPAYRALSIKAVDAIREE